LTFLLLLLALSLLLLLRLDASSSVGPSAPSLPLLPAAAAASCCVLLPPAFSASALSLLDSAAADVDVLAAFVLHRQHQHGQLNQGSLLLQTTGSARDRRLRTLASVQQLLLLWGCQLGCLPA
jgi:hypothetical protein